MTIKTRTTQTAQSAVFLCLGILLSIVLVPTAFTVTGFGLLFLTLFPRSRKFSGTRAYHIWIAYDRLWNALLWHDSRETISSRLGKSIYYRHPPVFNWRWVDRVVGAALDRVDTDHCATSIDWAVGRGVDWHRRPWGDSVYD